MRQLEHLGESLAALGEHCPDVASWLAGDGRDVPLDALFVDRAGRLDWRCPDGEGMYARVPRRLAYADWTPAPDVTGGVTLVLGCGLGDGLLHILEHSGEDHRVFVLEPRRDLLLACLGAAPLGPYLRRERLVFLPPDLDWIADHARSPLGGAFAFGKLLVRLDEAAAHAGAEYAAWLDRLRNFLDDTAVNILTMRRFQDVRVANELRNLGRAMAEGSALPLADSAAGTSAVLVGAGPSLERLLPGLAQALGPAIWACALQTLPAMQRLGVAPTFCVATDSSRSMLAVFDMLDAETAASVPLLYSTAVDPELLERYPGPTLPLWTWGGQGTWIMEAQDLVLPWGGNVSVILIHLARLFGVDRILLLGHDLAWTGTQSHAEGHHAARGPSGEGSVRLRAAAGGTITTTPQLRAAAREIARLGRQPGAPIHNFYGGGILLDGVENVDPDHVPSPLLAGGVAGVEGFARALREAFAVRKRPLRIEPQTAWLEDCFERAEREAAADTAAFQPAMRRLALELRSNPICLPYLGNEALELDNGEVVGAAALAAVRERAREKVTRIETAFGAATA